MRRSFAGCLVACQFLAACTARTPDIAAPAGVNPSSVTPREIAAKQNPRAVKDENSVSASEERSELAQDDESASAAERPLGEMRRGSESTRDYAIRVGIGFSEEEEALLRRAAETWARATGLPLHLRGGYGPLGNFHIAETIPVCGQRWVYDGYLGCYSPEFDNVVLSRPGLQLWTKEEANILFIVLLHEIGHWLGLSHASEGEDSVMLPDYPTLARRRGELSALSERDVRAVCSVNPCRI